MNNKGQDGGFGIIVFLIVILVLAGFGGYSYRGIVDNDNLNLEDMASNNFCRAWANEQGYTHIKGYYEKYSNYEPDVICLYSTDAETFDGGTSKGEIKNKHFEISKADLQQWRCK